MQLKQRLPVFHIEDEKEWCDTVRDILASELPELEYKSLEGPIESALNTLGRSTTPAIALFDLRLVVHGSEYDSLHKILLHVRQLQKQNIAVFVLSGHLSHDGLRLLANQGIPRERIYAKSSFQVSVFAQALSKASTELLSGWSQSMQGPFRLTHLSDIHVGEQGGYHSIHDDVRYELLIDLRAMAQKRGSANALAITGDIAYSGKGTEYLKAGEWLKLACQNAGCAADMVYVVPGNHDVNWANISGAEILHKGVRSCSSVHELLESLARFRKNSVLSDLLLAKLQDYREFAQVYGHDLASYDEACWSVDLPGFHDPTLRLVGMNTVLFSDKHDAKGQIILPPNQYVLPRERNVEHIVMMHHPLEWLHESQAVRSYVENRARICMMGHGHVLRVDHVSNLAGFERLDFHAGATTPPSADRFEYRYNWLELSVETVGATRELVVSLWPRIWTSAARFAADRNDLGGHEYRDFRLPLASS